MTTPELEQAALTLAGAWWRLGNLGAVRPQSSDALEAQALANQAAQTIRKLTAEGQPVCRGNGG